VHVACYAKGEATNESLDAGVGDFAISRRPFCFTDGEWRPRKRREGNFSLDRLAFAFEIRDIALSIHLAPEFARRVQMRGLRIPAWRNDNFPSAFLESARSNSPSLSSFVGGALKFRRRLPRL